MVLLLICLNSIEYDKICNIQFLSQKIEHYTICNSIFITTLYIKHSFT